MEEPSREQAGPTLGREGPKKKRTRWLKVLAGVGSAALLPTFALAANPTGCMLPYHGTTIDVTRVGNTTMPVRILGFSADNATRVDIQVAKSPTRNSSGPLSIPSNGWTTIASVTPTLNADGNKQYDTTVQVPLGNEWPLDRTAVMRAMDTLSTGGTLQENTFSTSGAATPHKMLGYVDLPSAGGTFPDLAAFPNTTRFLNQKINSFLSAKGDTFDAGFAYYKAIGAPGHFQDWLNVNGFNQGGDTVAYYRNENDLGFGREMHCRTVIGTFAGPSRIACYVTNYANEDDAAALRNRTATVAMEWDFGGFPKATNSSTVLDPKETVRFYVYDTGVGAATDLDHDNDINDLITKIALDGGGEKNVPQLCQNCHGGSYVAAANDRNKKISQGSRFLNWDLATLPVPAAAGAQAVQFKSLNQLTYFIETLENRGSSALNELTLGWYGGTPANAGPLFDPASSYSGGFTPPAWSGAQGNTGMYQALVAPYCRSCHVAIPAREFGSLANFEAFRSKIHAYACDRTTADRIMPHSQRTFAKFWQSGAPAYLNIDMGAANCKFKLF